jgi:head-tail adaptor
VTLRFRPDVASGMRFMRGERVWDILTAHDPDETGRYLVCQTREVGR